MNSTTSPAKGYYSILRYVPDLERGEGANIGVVLFCPEKKFLKARTAFGNDRVRRFFRGDETIKLDPKRLNAFKKAFEERISMEAERVATVGDFKQFIDTRANQLLLSDPRPMKVFEPESDLTKLFESLVGGRHLKTEQSSAMTKALQERMIEALRNLMAERKIRKGVRVELPLLDRTVFFPFYCRNGADTYVQTAVFEASPKQNIHHAARFVIEGLGVSALTTPSNLTVLASFRAEDRESYEHVRDLLERVKVSLYATTAIDELAGYIARTAHDLDDEVDSR